MLTKKSPKISYKFFCEKCDYKCGKQSEYNKHLTTAKHKKLTMLTDKIPKIPTMLTCELCGKQYKSRTGLWQHQKKCTSENNTELNKENNIKTKQNCYSKSF